MRLAIGFAIACGAGQHGADETGDGAQILCTAECKRELRCGGSDDCARCATLPVRTPAVWSAGWGREVGACIDRASCAHDSDEACVFTSRRTRAAVLCADAHDKLCAVLEGLTPDADARVSACYEQHGDRCMPPFDWK